MVSLKLIWLTDVQIIYLMYHYKNRLFYLSIFFLLTHVSYSQIFLGLQGGISNNYLETNISNRASTAIKSHIGYSVSIPIMYKVNDWISFQTDPNISQKNYSINRIDSFIGIYTQYNNTYLQLPLSTSFYYGNKVQIFATLGSYFGYWLTGQEKGKIPNIFSVTTTGNGSGERFLLTAFDQKYQFNSQRDNRLEFGWLTGIGIQYRPKDSYNLIIECLYYQSVTDNQNNYMANQIPQYNKTLFLSFSLLWPLKNKTQTCK